MKTIEIESYGELHDVYIQKNVYAYNDNLCLDLIDICGEPWSNLTVNFDIPLNKDEGFIDVNHNPGICEILIEKGIAKPTGKAVKSGYIIYPLYRFDFDVLNSYVA